MEQKLTKEQYDEILKELREIKKILTDARIKSNQNSSLKVVEKKGKELVSKGEESLCPKRRKTIWHLRKNIVDEICERIDSACYDAIINAYGTPDTPRRKWWNLITGGNHV